MGKIIERNFPGFHIIFDNFEFSIRVLDIESPFIHQGETLSEFLGLNRSRFIFIDLNKQFQVLEILEQIDQNRIEFIDINGVPLADAFFRL